MTKEQQLLAKLTQKMQQLMQKMNKNEQKVVLPYFDPKVFSENFRPFSYYQQAIEQTLQQMENKLQQPDVFSFLAEKFLMQYEMLADYARKTPSSQKIQSFAHIHHLPPRERLAKYYEVLSFFNEKITELEDQYRLQPKELLAQHIHYQQMRRQKCLEAIEKLEANLRRFNKKS